MFKNVSLNKTQVFIGAFTLILLSFMSIIFYQLISFEKEEEVVIPPVKTKAVGKTYRKEIALNVVSPTLSPQEPTPTEAVDSISPTENPITDLTPSPTLIAQAEEMSPTPTDIIVANLSPTQKLEQNSSPTPTPVKTLPKAGFFYYNILLFALGAFIIVISLVI